MSARDDLTSALWDNYTTAEKNQFIDAFAYELAEKIRSQQCPEEILAVELGWAAVWRRGVNDSADLIDPEVKP